jgi:calcium-dependent protein kinase
MAPERIRGQLDSNSENQKKCDMWSIGILLYLLICGCPPFEGKTNDELQLAIRRSEFQFIGLEFDGMPDVKNLIYSLLQVEPIDRIDTFEASNH